MKYGEAGIECRIRRRKKRTRASAELSARPNILARQLHADAPFEKAVTDVTEFTIGGHRVYVSALLDLYDGAVISIAMSCNNTDLIMSMFDSMSQAKLDRLENILIHSDQGVLYRTVRYHEFAGKAYRAEHVQARQLLRQRCCRKLFRNLQERYHKNHAH